MENLLKAKSWIIFTLMIVGFLLLRFSIENDIFTTLILNIFGLLIYMIYPLSVGLYLHDHLPKRIELNYTLFIINSFVWFITYAVIMIISDNKGMTFTGFSVIPMLYVIYAFLDFLAFPVRVLKSIELERRAKFGDYLGDFFLILFFPIGIWFLQPRIRKIVVPNGEITN